MRSSDYNYLHDGDSHEEPSPGSDAYEEESSGKTLFQWMKPTWKKVRWGGLILGCLAAIAFIGLQFWANWYYGAILRNNVLYVPMKEFLQTTATFPAEYVEEIPLSDSLNRAYEEVETIRKPIDSFRENIDQVMSRKNVQEMKELLDSMEPHVSIAREFAKNLEQEIVSYTPGEILPIHHPEIDTSFRISQWFHNKADALFNEKRYNEACELYMDIVPLLIRDAYQDFNTHLNYFPTYQYLFTQIDRALPDLKSHETMKTWLDRLNRIEPYLFPNVMKQAELLVKISVLNDIRRRFHHPVQPGEKWEYYYVPMAKDHIQEMDFSYCLAQIEYRIFSGSNFTEREIAGLLRPFVLSKVIDEYFLLCYYPYSAFNNLPSLSNFEFWREDAGMQFDTLRLRLAAHLYEQKYGKKVAFTTDLVPEFLPREIKDRTSGRPFRWNSDGSFQRVP